MEVLIKMGLSVKKKNLLIQGLCIDCGENRPDASRYRCRKCLDKAKSRAKMKYGGKPKYIS